MLATWKRGGGWSSLLAACGGVLIACYVGATKGYSLFAVQRNRRVLIPFCGRPYCLSVGEMEGFPIACCMDICNLLLPPSSFSPFFFFFSFRPNQEVLRQLESACSLRRRSTSLRYKPLALQPNIFCISMFI